MQFYADGWTVHLFDDLLRGYFEHDDTGEGGGLWFARSPEGVVALIDYDGVFALPHAVFNMLKEAGIHMEPEFDPDYEIGEQS